eukprot:m.92205 g.92205  ORF g.92205 m.92205 type:complete len:428 (+) comp26528_c0_seq2:134-1417(+)
MMDAHHKHHKAGGSTTVMVMLCTICAHISYADRAFLSVVVISMTDELGWTLADKAAVMGSFFPGYATSQVFGVWLSSHYGAKNILVWAMCAWSLITVLTPLAATTGVQAMCITRFLLGVFEGVTFPVMYQFLSPWLSSDQRGKAVGSINAGSGSGSVLAFLISPMLGFYCGWRSTFYFYGVVGLLVALLWQWFAIEKVSDTSTNKQLMDTQANRGMCATVRVVISMLRHPSVVSIIYCHVCNCLGGFMLLTWLPTILHERFDTVGTGLWVSAIPCLGVMGGAVAGGFITDKLVDNGVSLTRTRRLVCVGGFGVSAVCIWALATTTSIEVFLLLILIERTFVTGGSCGGYEAGKLDVATGPKVGLLQGVSNTCGALAGATVQLTAYIVAVWGWEGIFYLLAFAYTSAALIFGSVFSAKRVFTDTTSVL